MNCNDCLYRICIRGVVGQAFHSRTQEAEEGGALWDEEQPDLYSKFQASWVHRETLSQNKET